MNIAIILASGIGNTILFTPTLTAIRKRLPRARITLIVREKAFVTPVLGTGLYDRILYLPRGKLPTLRFLLQHRGTFDISLTAFPSNRWEFNLFAGLLGAKRRITHGYAYGKLRTLSALQNIKVPADEKLHDIEQNLNLLRPLSIELPKERKTIFHIPKEAEKDAQELLKRKGIKKESPLIGVHAGGSASIGERKRYSINNFAQLIKEELKEKPDAIVLLLGGKEETEQRRKLKRLLADDSRIHLINATLPTTAALIKRCDHFVSNDTGLMHIAATLGIKQKAIFTYTNWRRTAPRNSRAEVVKLNKKIRFTYPFRSVKP